MTEDKDLYLAIADELKKTNQTKLIKRAELLRRQCKGEVANEVFYENIDENNFNLYSLPSVIKNACRTGRECRCA